MAYYYYKLKTDNGGAPCVTESLLSLAICKGQIRSTAKEGDWIFGFGGRSTIRERLIYVARVTEKPPDGTYYDTPKYQRRLDCIYEWNDGELRWKENSRLHEGGSKSDIGEPPHTKAAVLLSDDFRYFGKAGTEDYKAKFPILADAVYRLGQGHRVNHSPELENELTALRRELWSKYRQKRIGSPTESDLTRMCNTIEGSLARGSC